MKLRARVVLLEDKAKRAMIGAAAKLGIKKYKRLAEGLSANMTNDRATNRFIREYGIAEEEAVRRWMEGGIGRSYLDIGAGSGRFSKMALESGAKTVTAIDINEDCLAELGRMQGVNAIEMDARNLQFDDNSIDRVMILGNTLAGMYESLPGEEWGFQIEVLKEMVRVAREEVAITLQRPESLGLMLQYYRMNGLELYDYDDKKGIKRIRMRKPAGTIEYRSQHFEKEDIERLLEEAGIDKNKYEIEAVNRMNWIVTIRKN